MDYFKVMRIFLLTLVLVAFAFCEDGPSYRTTSHHSAVYIERIARDTVFVNLEPEVDTVHVKVNTISYDHRDSVYNHHLLYLQYDLFSGLYSIFWNTAINVGVEVSFSPKSSLLLNYHYAKKEPEEESSNTFDIIYYSGNISQHDMGLGYRRYFQTTRFSPFFELGGNYLIRKTDYNRVDIKTKNNPPSDHDCYKGFQPYVHFGLARRDDNFAFGVSGGLSYNVVHSFANEILDSHFLYIASGLQLDLRLNFSVGVL